ncbi:hypothetical protein MKK84_32825 [Methylobacterium sp. E-065]|uniref:hypothetical protein n=1 Tax=Methylobacterium sp. E-065 TaxID=2836583 RepID=UPI001FBB737E|nr:hypothetical protein [Methylobacterium sp. E-065]MCJ2022133.1 hypothetical protein [Methylobacterium sp. E-065]
MHARIELSYAASERIRKMTRPEREQLVRLLPTFEVPLDEEVPEKWTIAWNQRDFTIDLSDIGPKLIELGLSFEVKRFTGCYRLAEPGKSGPGTTNNIQIAIPNLLLFAVDEVKLLDDACTDLLQSHLDEGWRILAVCPPPAQRRPDYIIGRQRGQA